jgi:hypothetical protein
MMLIVLLFRNKIYVIINGSSFGLTNQIVNRNLDQIVIGPV